MARKRKTATADLFAPLERSAAYDEQARGKDRGRKAGGVNVSPPAVASVVNWTRAYWKVLRFLYHRGEHGANDSEAAAVLGLPENTYQKARLRLAGDGLVSESGRRGMTARGRRGLGG